MLALLGILAGAGCIEQTGQDTGEQIIAECTSDRACGSGRFCQYRDGQCGGGGTCQPKPELASCPQVSETVCGCDGGQYGNRCRAASIGVSVAYAGECRSACDERTPCPEGEYCQRPDGQCGGAGTCQPKTDRAACPAVYEPVCGCDGGLYGNRCRAASIGVNVAYAGECRSVCDERTPCLEGEYCQRPDGQCGGAGTCQPKTDRAACPAVYEPVCGCDGGLYGNRCRAASIGVNVAYAGECGPRACTGNADCAADQYCHRLDGQCTSAGVCRTRGEVCTQEYAPVCGCDGQEYGNRCRASTAGVTVAYDGPCRRP